jgi:hypothetical protein
MSDLKGDYVGLSDWAGFLVDDKDRENPAAVEAIELKKGADKEKADTANADKSSSPISPFAEILIDPWAIMDITVLARRSLTLLLGRCFMRCAMHSSDYTAARDLG